MENYKYTVLFEAENLSDAELRQMQKYFKIRRRSGGGECEINKVGDTTYKISFMEREGKVVLFIYLFFLHHVMISAMLLS